MWWWKPWESAFLNLPPGAVFVEIPGPHEENLRLKNAFQHRSSRIVGQQQMKTPSTHGLIGDLRVLFFLNHHKRGFFRETFPTDQPDQPESNRPTDRETTGECLLGWRRTHLWFREGRRARGTTRTYRQSRCFFGSCCVGYTSENERLEHKN